jgi:hypothetical protein
MNRSIVSGCLLVLAALPLAGCGSKSKVEADADPSKKTIVAQVDSPTPAPDVGKKSRPIKAGDDRGEEVPRSSPYTGGVVTAYELAQEFQADRERVLAMYQGKTADERTELLRRLWRGERALAKYRGKTVTVAGVVRFITTAQADKQVTLCSGTDEIGVKGVRLQFFFGVSGKETLKPVEADFKKRHTAAGLGKDPEYPVITIRGVCRSFAGNGLTSDSNQLLFDNCTIVETPSGMDRKAVVGVPATAERVDLAKLLAAYTDPDNGDRLFKGKAVEVTGYLNHNTGNPVNVLTLRVDSTSLAIYLQAHINPNDTFKTGHLGQDSQVTVRGVMRGGVVRPLSGKENHVTLDNAEIVAVENTRKATPRRRK